MRIGNAKAQPAIAVSAIATAQAIAPASEDIASPSRELAVSDVRKDAQIAFSDAEEKLVGMSDEVPFLLSTRLRELGAEVENGLPMLSHVRQDRQLITGQNPKSSKAAAELLLKALDQGVSVQRPKAPTASLGMRGTPR